MAAPGFARGLIAVLRVIARCQAAGERGPHVDHAPGVDFFGRALIGRLDVGFIGENVRDRGPA
jgi:hypothetical protein